MTVFAAGMVGWRKTEQGIEFVLVYREKYKDWGFPKGKVDPGEYLPETAVREVQEEVGLRVKLGRKLPVASYELPTGETKEVHYWACKVSEKAQRKSKFAPNEEIADVVWVTAAEGLQRLSYDHDRELLRHVIELNEAGELETTAIIVLRHATATPRSEWRKGEDTRPLLPEGAKQAQRLISLLDAYGPRLLMTSSWRRCRDTLAPYANHKNRKLVERSQLSELGSQKGPKRLARVMTKLLEESMSAAICTHRPALPPLLELLKRGAKNKALDTASLEDLSPGSFGILRFSIDSKPRLVDIERVDLISS